MKYKQLGLRVLSTAALMSIVSSIAASAFAGTYYMDNGDVNVEVKENGDVYVNNQKDEDGEVIIKGGSGTNTWSNKKAEEQKAEEQQEETSIGESYPVEEEPEAEPAAEEPEEVEPEQPEETGEEPETAETAEEEQPEPEGSEEAAEESEADEPAGETDPEENPDETDKEQDTEDAADETPVEEDAEPSGEAADEETAPAEQELAEEPAEEETTEPSEDETPAESPNTISIKNDWKTNLKIILDNVNIKAGGSKAALSVTGKGSTTIELDGDNVLDSSETSGNAGLEVGQDTTVTITDTDGTVDDRASLKATSGNGGAGIGGSYKGEVGDITITGNADVTATCKNGVGIGTGQTTGQWPEIRKDTTITINDHAKVDASGSTGIGSSGQNYGNLKIILADFAKVKATSTSGAAIGTGRDSSSKLVNIIIGTAGKTSDEEHVEVDADGNSIYLTKADLEKIIGEDGTGKITYRIKDKTTGEYTLQYVVHGKDGCIWVLDEDQSVASTCTTKGKVVYVCKLEDGAVNAACHYGDDGTNTRTIELELAEHTWDDGVITTDPTCTTAGKKVKHCKNAPDEESHDFVETIAVDPTNHVHIKVDGKQDATCGKPGYTGDTVCDTCGKVLESGTVLPATGSNDSNAACELHVVVPGSTQRELWFTVRQSGGERTYTCKQDNATLTGSLETLQYLQSQGADTIVFVTNGRVSRFAVADLLALCNEGDVFYLCHTADAEPTLLIIANDHTELLNS